MKKTLNKLCFAATLLMLAQFSYAQDSRFDGWEIGARFGDTNGSSFVIDAMMPLIGKRVHANVGFEDGLNLSALLNFNNTLSEGFSWYYGFGPEVGFFDDFALAVAGEIGLQFALSAPLTLGVDYRPSLLLIGNDTGFKGARFGFNVRYRF